MPTGRYVALGGDGSVLGSEDFRCAPGPMGWRYFSDVKTVVPTPHDAVVDVAVDAAWRPVRVRIETGAHSLLLQADEDRLKGYRDGVAVDAPWGPETHLGFPSPAFTAITCMRLGEASADVELLAITASALQVEPERHSFARIGPEQVETKVGVFDAIRWRVSTPGNETSRDLWIAGDVVARWDGAYELTAYEAGASGSRPRP
jgi:hypothetical protein